MSVDGSGSDYSAGVIVVTGSPGSFQSFTCGTGAVGFSAAAVPNVAGFNGSFAGGRAKVDAFIFACGAIGCATDEVGQTVLLRH